MNEKEIKHIISSRLKTIKKYCRKIPKSFDAKDIHAFRTEVKKLRAFIRLVTFVPNHGKEYKLPKKLKNVYSAAGDIRDIQLQLQRIKAVTQNDPRQPEQYETVLEKNLRKKKKILRKLLAGVSFGSIRQKLLSRLPKKLQFINIQHFVQQKTADIKLLSANYGENDDDIHSIRKNLKDLMYNVKTFPEVYLKEAFPRELADADTMNGIEQLTDQLGMFTDMSAAITFTEPSYLDAITTPEKEQLHHIRGKWLKERNELRQAALDNIRGQDVLE